MGSTDERDTVSSIMEKDPESCSAAKTAHDTTQKAETLSEESYPPPKVPMRLVKWVIGVCIFITLVIVTIFIVYMLFRR